MVVLVVMILLWCGDGDGGVSWVVVVLVCGEGVGCVEMLEVLLVVMILWCGVVLVVW